MKEMFDEACLDAASSSSTKSAPSEGGTLVLPRGVRFPHSSSFPTCNWVKSKLGQICERPIGF